MKIRTKTLQSIIPPFQQSSPLFIHSRQSHSYNLKIFVLPVSSSLDDIYSDKLSLFSASLLPPGHELFNVTLVVMKHEYCERVNLVRSIVFRVLVIITCWLRSHLGVQGIDDRDLIPAWCPQNAMPAQQRINPSLQFSIVICSINWHPLVSSYCLTKLVNLMS